MVDTPKFSQIPFDALILGGIGYLWGRLAEVDAKLSATVLVISSLVNHLFFQITNNWVQSKFTITSKSLYTATNMMVTMITILAAKQLDLISNQFAGMGIFISIAVLMSRIKMISSA